jgi:hypothetical protein
MAAWVVGGRYTCVCQRWACAYPNPSLTILNYHPVSTLTHYSPHTHTHNHMHICTLRASTSSKTL